MDLTTVECQLLVGARYASPEDFLEDVALVFANSIRFNKDGKDIGDALACAYYDASIHLLRYARWLAMEILGARHADHSSAYTDEGTPDGLPPVSWKLTEGNLKVARQEMEKIVYRELIEKSLKGDSKYTWHEAECEKLLKALRHQSDLKYMKFFVNTEYPADYAAYISKPMDWEKIHKTLKNRQYDRFGEVVDDLRLIFSNAFKYNARHKGMDNVSGQAYAAAEFMSAKLEVAISKMILTVSDKLERERIDHVNGEREIEAQEKVEEERVRAGWKREDRSDNNTAMIAPRPRPRKLPLKRQADFENPFFEDEEDSGGHEHSHSELVKVQKALFEKQTRERKKLRESSCKVGAAVFTKRIQQQMAIQWKKTEEEKLPKKAITVDGSRSIKKSENQENAASSVLAKLESSGRSKISLQLARPAKRRKVPKRRKGITFE